MALTKITGQVINTTTDVTVGILTVTDTLAVGGTVSVGGTLTYEDVTNIDSVGIITARSTIDAQGDVSIADKIIHTGDTTTSIRFPAADTISFETAGNPRARIDSSGRFLIGTTTEGNESADELTVNSSGNTGVTIRSGTSSNGSLYFSDTTSGADEYVGFVQYQHASTNAMIFGTSSTERIRITSTGAVGINSTNPENNLLELYTDASAAWKFRIHTSVSDGAGFYQRANGDFEVVLRDASNNNNNISGSAGGLQFTTSNTEKVRITSAGKVGIGTETVSGAKLDVIDGFINVGAAVTTHDARIQFTRKDTGIYSWIGIPTWNPNAFYIYGPKDSNPYNEVAAIYESSTWSFYTAGSVRLQINPSGHVLPAVNDTYDLGSSSYRWRDIYTGDLNLSNKGKSNDVDGSWGDYTIQEGESDLFLINNRSGKKFKFNLTEVL